MEESGGSESSVSLTQRNCILLLVLLALAFGITYSQSPLFTSNQNQYFLHGIARAGIGFLQNDWLANTKDPTPVFSSFVSLLFYIFRFQEVFHLVYLAMLGIYFFSCLGIARQVGEIRDPLASFLFIVLLILIHSSAFRYFIGTMTTSEWAYFFEGGLAGQRILGTVLQPSSFGVLFFLSIYFFLIRKNGFAIIAILIATALHPTYLLPAAMIVLAYLWEIYQDESARKAAGYGILGILLVLPIVFYVLFTFRPSSPEEYARAQEILAHFRIPHHAVIKEWLDLSSIIQVVFIFLAAYLVRKTRLLPLFVTGICISLFLSILQVLSGSDTLALLFPWRVSSILVPLSTTVLLVLLVEALFRRKKFWFASHKVLIYLSGGLLILLAMSAGIVYFIQEYKDRLLSPESELYRYVDESKQAGDKYLIPIDMQDFRLASGAVAFIDFKSIPYQDQEVLEWHRRVLQASDFYRKKRIDCSELQDWLKGEEITHLVIPFVQKEPDCSFLEESFGNDGFWLFKVTR